MKLGGHAVLFTDRIANETETILQGFHDAGCEGVEIGMRFFGAEKNNYLKEMLDAHHLQLSGLHVSFQWLDCLDNLVSIRAAVEKAAEFLQVMEHKNIILTGMVTTDVRQMEKTWDFRLQDPKMVKWMAEALNELAVMAKAKGVQIHYHNHDWEFKNDGLLFNSLLGYAPDMMFALDTGWAASMGKEPAKMIEMHPDRYSYVHLRDLKKENVTGNHSFVEKQDGYVDLGCGDLDYPELIRVLKNCLGDKGWAVIEYEKGEVSFARYQKAVSYIRNLMAENS